MLKFDIGYEAPSSSAGRMCGSTAHDAGTSNGASKHVAQLLRRHLLDVLANFTHDCLVGVAVPTDRTGVTVLGVRFSDAFNRHAALCAKSLHSLVHDSSPAS